MIKIISNCFVDCHTTFSETPKINDVLSVTCTSTLETFVINDFEKFGNHFRPASLWTGPAGLRKNEQAARAQGVGEGGPGPRGPRGKAGTNTTRTLYVLLRAGCRGCGW